MKVKVELGNEEVREMLISRIRELVPEIIVEANEIKITVRSRQNYRNNEWESGEVRAEYEIEK